jgi:hypothetical protein
LSGSLAGLIRSRVEGFFDGSWQLLKLDTLQFGKVTGMLEH